MQEKTITDIDGVRREYGYDDFGGALYIKDSASKSQNPGRPYRPIYGAKRADIRTLQAAHAEMWQDPAAAQEAITTMSDTIGWRNAH